MTRPKCEAFWLRHRSQAAWPFITPVGDRSPSINPWGTNDAQQPFGIAAVSFVTIPWISKKATLVGFHALAQCTIPPRGSIFSLAS